MTTLKSRVRVTIDPSGTVATAIETSVSSGATIDQPLQAAEARPASVLSDSTMLSSIAAGELFGVLVKRSAELPYRFPTEHNRLTAIIAAAPETHRDQVIAEIEDHARSTRAVLLAQLMPLLSTFLTIKTGPTATEKEKAVYHGMTVSGLVDRLLRKRPLMFMTSADQFLLTNGMDGAGAEKFDLIGSEEEAAPHLLNDLQSYDEMALSSMLGVSVPTHFINSGDRGNQAVPTELEVVGGELVGERHERRGIYIAQVGARFERAGRMEYRWMVVQDTQNTTSAGYGREGDPLLLAWAKFYGVPYFPTYDEVKTASAGRNAFTVDGQRYVVLKRGWGSPKYFNLTLFRKRCEMAAELFLREADARASKTGTTALCRVVGLGLGVWAVDQSQARELVDAYGSVLQKHQFPHISDLHFTWFRVTDCAGVTDGGILPNTEVRVHFNRSSPADKLVGEDVGKLLVAQYAWDGGSYPGNEYWLGMLSASGDPAAACCSTIAELQNPDVNKESISAAGAVILGNENGESLLQAWESKTASML